MTELIAAAPAEWSKSFKKALLKKAETAAKKLAKGPAKAPPPPSGKKSAAAADTPGTATKVPTAPPPVPTGGCEGVVGAAESALVSELLATIETLGLSAEAMSTLRANEAKLGIAIAPQVSSVRNSAYAAGFSAK